MRLPLIRAPHCRSMVWGGTVAPLPLIRAPHCRSMVWGGSVDATHPLPHCVSNEVWVQWMPLRGAQQGSAMRLCASTRPGTKGLRCAVGHISGHVPSAHRVRVGVPLTQRTWHCAVGELSGNHRHARALETCGLWRRTALQPPGRRPAARTKLCLEDHWRGCLAGMRHGDWGQRGGVIREDRASTGRIYWRGLHRPYKLKS